MDEEIVYRHTVEGLFRSIGSSLTPDLRTKLNAVGLDLDAQSPRNTSRQVFADALRVTVEHLYPNVESDEGYRRLGVGIIHGVEQTVLGKALVSMWPIFGPERVVVRIQESFETVNNYMKSQLLTQGPAHHIIRVNECNGNPGYLRGIIEAGLTRAGARNLRVESFDFDGHACSYRIRWGD
ncbi:MULTISPECIES: DUF2378 family protein [Corallococcus]|uniref:DUF2378 family protein n=1 Tax=Corallococcus TaxID=83461 RepID=UPI00117D1548|nr:MULTISPECIES: DUF2378 family protein [Corallococcus]NBD10819.1 DUF2378 family protein [Corallococcus silvisoli]TSC31737.1 DUF2378 family protein [Corallococcus sp. Z5C101001]